MIVVAARRKAMMAAEAVDVATLREAAILGGIVRSVIACGKINVPWCGQYAADVYYGDPEGPDAYASGQRIFSAEASNG